MREGNEPDRLPMALRSRYFLKNLSLSNFKGFEGESQALQLNGPDGHTEGSGLTFFVGEDGPDKEGVLQAVCSFFTLIPESKIRSFGEGHDRKASVVRADFSAVRFGDPEPVSLKGLRSALREGSPNRNYQRTWKSNSNEREQALCFRQEAKASAELNVDLLHFWSRGGSTTYRQVLNAIADYCGEGKRNCAWNAACGVCAKCPVAEALQKVSRKWGDAHGLPELEVSCEPDLSGQTVWKLVVRQDKNVIPLSSLGKNAERLLALLLVEEWAEAADKAGKSCIIVLDEPECSMHPKVQRQFMEMIWKLTKRHQVIISTQSPLMLFSPHFTNAKTLVVQAGSGAATQGGSGATAQSSSGNGGARVVNLSDPHAIFPGQEPSLAMLYWLIYGVAVTDFHNELYGYLWRIGEPIIPLTVNKPGLTEADFDDWFKNEYADRVMLDMRKVTPGDQQLMDQSANRAQKQCNSLPRKPKPPKGRRKPLPTLQTFVRNAIHHPEEPHYPHRIIDSYLDDSTETLVEAVKRLNKKLNLSGKGAQAEQPKPAKPTTPKP